MQSFNLAVMKNTKLNILIFIIILIVLLIFYNYKGPSIQSMYLSSKTMKLNLTTEKQLKTILYWNPFFLSKNYRDFGLGHEPFEENCVISTCYATNNRSYQNIDKFDAILIHGPLYDPDENPLLVRSPDQYVVLLNHEGPVKFPTFWGYPDLVNITITYRLDSDLFVPYLRIYDTRGDYVAPKLIPKWIKPLHDVQHLNQFSDLYHRKSKPIAWFVSNCLVTFNNRSEYVFELQKYISVDIYGNCGKLNCCRKSICSPEANETSCDDILKNDYFFYLSFENSNCYDYVSQRLYTPLKNDVVGVVMNGADMNRMAPPYSYIDARLYEPKQLAEYLKFLMANPMEYLKYHWWRKHYYTEVIHEIKDPLCTLCAFLNKDHNGEKHKSYANYYEWRTGSPGNRMCTRQVLKNQDNYQPQIDSETYFDVSNNQTPSVII